MKTLLSLFGGALTITELSGVVSLNWNESIGGGKAAGFLKGQGTLVLDGPQDLQLVEGFVNGKLPAAILPFALAGEGILNTAISAAE
jgi:hypothetical protein